MEASEERRRSVEGELTDLLGRVRSGRIKAKERRKIFARIRALQGELGDLGGPTQPELPEGRWKPRWWWLDPGKGAPSLGALAIGLVLGALVLVTFVSKCVRMLPGGRDNPSVQHLDPLPPARP